VQLALLRLPSAGVIGEDPAHRAGTKTAKMFSIPEVWRNGIGKAHVKLPDERRGLQCMIGLPPSHEGLRQLVHSAINQRQKRLQGVIVSGAPLREETRDRFARRFKRSAVHVSRPANVPRRGAL